jgi:hypothetical protein
VLDLAHEVARQHHRPPALGERADERAHLGHAAGVEPVRRLVEDQQLRVLQQRRGHAEPLPHAEGVRAHAVAGAVGQAGVAQHDAHALLGDAGEAGEHAQVVAAREVGVEGRALDDRAEPRQPVRGAGRRAEDGRLAGRRADQPEQHPQRRRLAGAVRAEQAVDLAAAHPQRQVLDRRRGAVALGQAAGLDHVLAHGSSFGRRRRPHIGGAIDPGWTTRRTCAPTGGGAG